LSRHFDAILSACDKWVELGIDTYFVKSMNVVVVVEILFAKRDKNEQLTPSAGMTSILFLSSTATTNYFRVSGVPCELGEFLPVQ
jgi:hypothetical protein